MTDLVQTANKDGIVEICLNRPDKKNALTVEMYQSMYVALVAAMEDETVKVVLFRGTDGVFTSGNDLQDFMQRPALGDDTPVSRFLSELAQFEKPVVAAVVGPAVGIGTTMLLHCDLVYAGDSAMFKMPFVDLGLIPEFGSSLILPQLVGHRRAAEYLMLGDSFDAQTAVDMGIANARGSDDQALEMARATAAKLAKKAPQALRMTKKLMKSQTGTVLEQIAAEGKGFADRLLSPELKEAGQAFFEKREPDFSKFA